MTWRAHQWGAPRPAASAIPCCPSTGPPEPLLPCHPVLGAQALKANPEGAPKEFKINANYLTKFGQASPSTQPGSAHIETGLPTPTADRVPVRLC